MSKSKRKKSGTKRKRKKRQTKVNYQVKRRRKNIRYLSLSLILTISLAFVIVSILFVVGKVEGYGMLTTYNDGHYIVFKRSTSVKRFSIVYLKVPSSKENSIRRVIGLPGEEIEYRDDELYVNSTNIQERWIDAAKQKAKADKSLFTEDFNVKDLTQGEQYRIPEGHYLVLGDNRPYATDSRIYGLIPQKAIMGVYNSR